MILTLVSLGILIIGIIAMVRKGESDMFDSWAGCLTGVGVILTIGIILSLLLIPISLYAKAEGFKAVNESLQVARESEDISPFELAAIQQKVIESNEWLAKTKFYAKHPATNWFISKDILDLEPIR